MRTTRQTASTEDYLKAIKLLAKERDTVRVTDISRVLNIKAPSVTQALMKLTKAGLVRHKKYQGVELTKEGDIIARDVNLRHETIRRFLIWILNIDPDIAEQDACGMEHTLSADSLKRLAKFIEFLSSCPLGTPECLKGFNYYIEHEERDEGLLKSCKEKEKDILKV
ncbi:MAG: metal-dependent transcriptional regulator [Dehalococcoidales bacterium]|nr:metal-dependent transcriptional regulator [Dehalococcoidales bacterium]